MPEYPSRYVDLLGRRIHISPRKRRSPAERLMASAAHWTPSTAALVVMALGLVVHEVAYHLTGGDDFPLTILGGDTRVVVISHGGLDALGVGILIVSVLWLIDVAITRTSEGPSR